MNRLYLKGGVVMKIKVLLIFLVLMSGCGTTVQGDPGELPGDKSVEEAYIAALEELMKEDEALNHQMEFLAIDMNNFELEEQQKQAIVDYFTDQYDVEVKSASLEELREQGHFDEERLVLDGVLLRLQDIERKSDTKHVFEGEKYKSGLGAIWLEIKVEWSEGIWEVTDSKITAIS